MLIRGGGGGIFLFSKKTGVRECCWDGLFRRGGRECSRGLDFWVLFSIFRSCFCEFSSAVLLETSIMRWTRLARERGLFLRIFTTFNADSISKDR